MPKKFYDSDSDSDSEIIGKALKKISPKKTTKEFGKVLKHLTSHIADVKEPVDPKDYKQAKEMINNIKTLKGGRIIPKSDVIVGPSIGKGLLDNLDIKDFEKLDKLIEDFGIKKKDKLRNLLTISKGTTERVKKEVKALKKAKVDKRFTRKGGMIGKGETEDMEAEDVDVGSTAKNWLEIGAAKPMVEATIKVLELANDPEVIESYGGEEQTGKYGLGVAYMKLADALRENSYWMNTVINLLERSEDLSEETKDEIEENITKLTIDPKHYNLYDYLAEIWVDLVKYQIVNAKQIENLINRKPVKINRVIPEFKFTGNGFRRAPITTLPVKGLTPVKVGKGVRPSKGTKEAKEFMAKLRSMRKSKN